MHPQTESYWVHVNPIGPRGVYDEAKRFAEAITMAYHRAHALEVRIVRIFNTYGPRMRPEDGRVVSNFIVQALQGKPLTMYGDGTQTRSFCYVDDEVRGLLALFDSTRPVRSTSQPNSSDARMPIVIESPTRPETSRALRSPTAQRQPHHARPHQARGSRMCSARGVELTRYFAHSSTWRLNPEPVAGSSAHRYELRKFEVDGDKVNFRSLHRYRMNCDRIEGLDSDVACFGFLAVVRTIACGGPTSNGVDASNPNSALAR